MGSLKSTVVIVVLCVTCLFASDYRPNIKAAEYNLICNGKYSKSYHRDYRNSNQYCRGLKSCRAEIIRLPSAEAKELRSDPCNFCYGR